MDEKQNLPEQEQDIVKSAETDLQENAFPELDSLEELTPAEAEEVMEGGDLQPLDPEDTIPEEERCTTCAENEREGDSPYCKACKEQMLQVKIGWETVVMAAVIIVFSFAAAGMFVLQSPALFASLKGDFYQLTHRYADAMDAYTKASDLITEVSSNLNGRVLVQDGIKSDFRRLDSLAKASSPISAGSYAKQLFQAEQLEGMLYARPARYAKVYDDFYASYEAVSKLQEPYAQVDAANIPYDEVLKQLEELNKEGKYAPVYMAYWKYNISISAGVGYEERLALLKEIEKADPERTDLYLDEYINCYWAMGDFDQLFAYCDRLKAQNRNNNLAYSARASVYLYQKKFDEALRVADEAAQYNSGSTVQYELQAEIYRRQNKLDEAKKAVERAAEAQVSSFELSRQEAIILLLQKDYDNAFEAAYNSYSQASQNNAQSVSVKMMNTLALCAALSESGQELYEQIQSSLEENGQTLEEDVLNCIDGKIQPADIFLSEKGDVV